MACKGCSDILAIPYICEKKKRTHYRYELRKVTMVVKRKHYLIQTQYRLTEKTVLCFSRGYKAQVERIETLYRVCVHPLPSLPPQDVKIPDPSKLEGHLY